EVVRRQAGEVARPSQRVHQVYQGLTSLLETAPTVARFEGVIHVLRRALARVAREDQQDPIVLRQLDGRQDAAVAGAELRPVREEEGNICSDLSRIGAQDLGGMRVVA